MLMAVPCFGIVRWTLACGFMICYQSTWFSRVLGIVRWTLTRGFMICYQLI
ncbi:hypothetical protein RchiOBHm_Chr2g0162321 [Rosa chinensis]|uniref:Uncharacterized protein n=1 Tax=Rosa chinensis TaxID=74649 RepID=A0A2P6S324_ROSCH|nr:hypothetical protein RchiOBHm_Chr2g0162321 [Rosa chinensis]